MEPPVLLTPYRLSRRRKWQLALGMLLIYYPIDVYVFNTAWVDFKGELLAFVVQFGPMLLFYFAWLHAAEWVLLQLFKWFGNNFLLDLKVPALLTLGSVSLVMALSFTVVYTRSNIFLHHTVTHLGDHRTPPSADFVVLYGRALQGFHLLLMLSSFYLLTTQYTQLRAQAIQHRTEQLEKEALQAQLEALKNQVNPHFLFNSLSILSSLIQVNADLAEQFVEQLAQAYRYTLEQRDHDLVPLGTEVAFIETYAFLLHLRFAEKFVLQLDIPVAAHQHYRIAPMTLQLLVENAVKHNQMSRAQPLRLTISIEEQQLVVRNTLQRRPVTYAAASTGVGLQNIRNRYRLLTPRPVTAGTGEGQFIVRIPLLT